MNFNYYHASDTAPIRTDHLKGYAADSRRALKGKGKTRRNRIKGHLASILNRLTLANSSVSVLLIAALPLVAQAHA
jgi:hypothetical protein